MDKKTFAELMNDYNTIKKRADKQLEDYKNVLDKINNYIKDLEADKDINKDELLKTFDEVKIQYKLFNDVSLDKKTIEDSIIEMIGCKKEYMQIIDVIVKVFILLQK